MQKLPGSRLLLGDRFVFGVYFAEPMFDNVHQSLSPHPSAGFEFFNERLFLINQIDQLASSQFFDFIQRVGKLLVCQSLRDRRAENSRCQHWLRRVGSMQRQTERADFQLVAGLQSCRTSPSTVYSNFRRVSQRFQPDIAAINVDDTMNRRNTFATQPQVASLAGSDQEPIATDRSKWRVGSASRNLKHQRCLAAGCAGRTVRIAGCVFHDVITGYELSDNVLCEQNGTVLIFVITTGRHQKIATVFLISSETLVPKFVGTERGRKQKKPLRQNVSAAMAFVLNEFLVTQTGW